MTQRKQCPVCGAIQPAGLDCRECATSLIDVPFLAASGGAAAPPPVVPAAGGAPAGVRPAPPPDPGAGPQATLVLQAGPGRVIKLKSGDVIGREASGAEHLSGNHKVSRRHARVTFEGGRWIITDLDSSNGLYVDGKPVKEAVLELGTEFSLSTTCGLSVAKC